MNHYRDFAGEYEWTAVDCDKKGAPEPVFVKPGWPNTRDLGTLVAEAAWWTLETLHPKIITASGLSDTDDITNVLRNLPTSKLVTEDLATAKRRTRQVRGAPPTFGHLRRTFLADSTEHRGDTGACGPACPGIGVARLEIGGCGYAAC